MQIPISQTAALGILISVALSGCHRSDSPRNQVDEFPPPGTPTVESVDRQTGELERVMREGLEALSSEVGNGGTVTMDSSLLRTLERELAEVERMRDGMRLLSGPQQERVRRRWQEQRSRLEAIAEEILAIHPSAADVFGPVLVRLLPGP